MRLDEGRARPKGTRFKGWARRGVWSWQGGIVR